MAIDERYFYAQHGIDIEKIYSEQTLGHCSDCKYFEHCLSQRGEKMTIKKEDITKLSDRDLKKINKEYIRRGLDKNATISDVYSTFTPSQKELTEILVDKALNGSDESIKYGVLQSMTNVQKTTMYYIVGCALTERDQKDEHNE